MVIDWIEQSSADSIDRDVTDASLLIENQPSKKDSKSV